MEFVLVADTLPTAGNELGVVCAGIASVVTDLAGQGITVRYQILGVDGNRDWTSDYVTRLIGDGTANHPQDWGPAIRDLSVGYPW